MVTNWVSSTLSSVKPSQCMHIYKNITVDTRTLKLRYIILCAQLIIQITWPTKLREHMYSSFNCLKLRDAPIDQTTHP